MLAKAPTLTPQTSQCCSPPAMPLSFGNRLWRGVCPPSNPARTPLPDRAFCPLIPNPQVPPYTDTGFAKGVLTSLQARQPRGGEITNLPSSITSSFPLLLSPCTFLGRQIIQSKPLLGVCNRCCWCWCCCCCCCCWCHIYSLAFQRQPCRRQQTPASNERGGTGRSSLQATVVRSHTDIFSVFMHSSLGPEVQNLPASCS